MQNKVEKPVVLVNSLVSIYLSIQNYKRRNTDYGLSYNPWTLRMTRRDAYNPFLYLFISSELIFFMSHAEIRVCIKYIYFLFVFCLI